MCENGKSETISFCNSTKGAVDTFHQKCSLQVVIQPLDQKMTSKRVFLWNIECSSGERRYLVGWTLVFVLKYNVSGTISL